MEQKKFGALAMIVLVSVLLISGCAVHSILETQSRQNMELTIKGIENNPDQYTIHAYQWPPGEVSAIVFDKKGDSRSIQNDGWTRVSSREQLSKVINQSRRNKYRRFFKIVGPDGYLYGYLLGGQQYVWIEAVGASTLKLYVLNWVPKRKSIYDPFDFSLTVGEGVAP